MFVLLQPVGHAVTCSWGICSQLQDCMTLYVKIKHQQLTAASSSNVKYSLPLGLYQEHTMMSFITLSLHSCLDPSSQGIFHSCHYTCASSSVL